MTPLSEAELEALYVKLERPVYNVVYRWVWQREEARDIVQDAFVRVWKMRDRVERGTAKALVYRIAINLAASRLRWQRIRTMLPVESLRGTAAPDSDPEATTLDVEALAQMRTAVLALPEQLRRVVMLTEYSDLPHAEIGKLLGVAPGTVASRRHRAIERLRKSMVASAEPGADSDDEAAKSPEAGVV